MTPDQLDQHLNAVQRSNEISRQQNQDVIDGHLQASAVVVAQAASMAAQGVLPKDFTK